LYSLRKNKSTPFWNQDKAISAKPIGNQTPLREGGERLSWGQVVYLRLSRTDWLSGSGGTGETSLHYRAISGKMRRFPSGGAAVRWNLPGWRAILLSAKSSGQKTVSQQPMFGGVTAKRIKCHGDS